MPHSSKPETELGLVVLTRADEADDVISLRLGRPAGEALPGWEPGAHVDPDLVRQYSLSGSPEDTGAWEIAVLRERDGRGGSERIFDTICEGSPVRVRGPRNHFRFEPAAHCRFVAG